MIPIILDTSGNFVEWPHKNFAKLAEVSLVRHIILREEMSCINYKAVWE
jgi:hypothetical protein